MAYFRLVGSHQEFTQLGQVQRERTKELGTLAATIRGLAPSLSRVYVYANNHYAGHAPATINQLKQLLDLPLTEPRSLWPRQLGLFGETSDRSLVKEPGYQENMEIEDNNKED